jgi:hypothetical protein
VSDPAPDAAPAAVSGIAAFAARATQMLAEARSEIALLSQELDRRAYGGEAVAEALRRFVLQHERTRVRILVHSAQAAVGNSPRFVELGRSLSSYVEFRELLPERRLVVLEEVLIADGRTMLHREAPQDLVARWYARAPSAVRLKLKDFDTLWNESEPAQELRRLGI